jgi:hypothetical protein
LSLDEVACEAVAVVAVIGLEIGMPSLQFRLPPDFTWGTFLTSAGVWQRRIAPAAQPQFYFRPIVLRAVLPSAVGADLNPAFGSPDSFRRLCFCRLAGHQVLSRSFCGVVKAASNQEASYPYACAPSVRLPAKTHCEVGHATDYGYTNIPLEGPFTEPYHPFRSGIIHFRSQATEVAISPSQEDQSDKANHVSSSFPLGGTRTRRKHIEGGSLNSCPNEMSVSCLPDAQYPRTSR